MWSMKWRLAENGIQEAKLPFYSVIHVFYFELPFSWDGKNLALVKVGASPLSPWRASRYPRPDVRSKHSTWTPAVHSSYSCCSVFHPSQASGLVGPHHSAHPLFFGPCFPGNAPTPPSPCAPPTKDPITLQGHLGLRPPWWPGSWSSQVFLSLGCPWGISLWLPLCGLPPPYLEFCSDPGLFDCARSVAVWMLPKLGQTETLSLSAKPCWRMTLGPNEEDIGLLFRALLLPQLVPWW